MSSAKRLAWTPGGFALSFGRMLQDGIVKKYLDEHCPDPRLQLCAYKDQLPQTPTSGSGAATLFDKLGRFAGLGAEMEPIALACLARISRPAAQDRTHRHRQQLSTCAPAKAWSAAIWHTYAIIERYTPAARAGHERGAPAA